MGKEVKDKASTTFVMCGRTIFWMCGRIIDSADKFGQLGHMFVYTSNDIKYNKTPRIYTIYVLVI